MVNKLIFLIISVILINANASSNEIVLPLKFNSGNPSPYGMATVDVKIGSKKMPLLFDLGDSKDFIVLKPEAVKGMHIHFTKEKTCGNTITGRVCLRNFIISQLQLGSLVLKNVPARSVKTLWGGGPDPDTGGFRYGLIGLKLLQKYNLLIDYPHAKVILMKSHQNFLQNKHWISIPFTLNGGIMTMTSINQHSPVKLIWDTGAVPSIIKNNHLFGSVAENCLSVLPYSKKNCQMIRTKHISIDGIEFPNTWFEIKKLPTFVPWTGLIGDNFFRNNIVAINFDKKNYFSFDVSKELTRNRLLVN